jgi:hypothetical protein
VTGPSRDLDELRGAFAFAIKRAARRLRSYEVHAVAWDGRTTLLATAHGRAGERVLFVPHGDPG